MVEAKYPHCDSRILHAPGKCEYCDMYPEAQNERKANRTSFTGEPPTQGMFPCPAEKARSSASLNAWGGNRAYPKGSPRPWDELTAAVVKALNPDDSKE